MTRGLTVTIALVMMGCTAVRTSRPAAGAESGVPAAVAESGVPAAVAESAVPAAVAESAVPAAVAESAVPAAVAAPAVPALYDTQRRITAYIDSGRYASDFERVVADATTWLEERAPKTQRPAIVLDIDETSLSNWQAYRVNGWARILGGGCDLEHGPCGIRTWQGMGRGVALVPTRTLVERAHALGVAVFFLTGRPHNLRASTARNLREQGYTFEGVVLLPEGQHFASAIDFKAVERKKLAEKGYTILLSMGDQQSDLDGGYAERTFKLPNPVYFLP